MNKTATIIGGGHNGLVCACYLARAGVDVTILERRSVVGGAAVTEEFHPGFRNSAASYTVSLLHPKVIADLHLHEHGLRIIERKINNYVPLPSGESLISYPDTDRFHAEIAQFSQRDVTQLKRYNELLDAVVPVIKDLMLVTPPSIIDHGFADIGRYFTLSKHFKTLNSGQKRLLLRLFSISAGEMLDDTFESDPIKALYGFDAIVGHFASPYAPGTAYVLLHHLVGQVNGKQGLWGHAVGGMGAITQAMAKEALSLGVKIVLDAEVENLEISRQKVKGITLKNGEVVESDITIANVNPKLLFCDLIESSDLNEDTRSHFESYKCQSGTFRMNVAISALPNFTARTAPHVLEAGIIMAPSLNYMDKAFTDARLNGWSKKPIVEMLIPSITDDSLAPTGQHVASLFCQQFDPSLGEKWNQHRENVADIILNTVDEYAPGFKQQVIARQIHSPWDLEQKFGLVGGDIFHGRLSLDQLFSARPMLGIGDYHTEFENLYLCGAGTHPGGGVSGLPGHNAAQEIIRCL
jgi:phytoene dehydrogenase-like protein